MTTQLVRGQGTKILVLNPNSSHAMTDGMKTVINTIDLLYSTEVHTYTAPRSAPPSINDRSDIEQSFHAVRCNFNDAGYDGIVVACFSVHPLVPYLQGYPTAITGIFEASVLTALSLLSRDEKWGIVTTGKFWEEHLTSGVKDFLGAGQSDPNSKFAGVESTGLNAGDFHHGVDPAVVREKLKLATKRLLSQGGVACIVMGCAGMAGLEEIIREAANDALGKEFASSLHVIDGVRAGIMQVEHMIKHQRLRPVK
ncbi:hydantoin racemase [Xylariaceae sp. FL0662B]|nr:hydantoin racemase [Xylariaceae sp. FL0662B]